MNVPEHIGIIPDGNRRLAKRLVGSSFKGHEWGMGKIKDIIDWCRELGIRVMTFYVLSLENLDRRPREELDLLFGIANKEIEDILNNKDHKIHRNRVRVRFFGRMDLLPPELQEGAGKVMERTKGYSDYYVNLAIAYGGRQEIVDASRRMAIEAGKGLLDPESIDETLMRRYFWTNGFADPDLIIRTGGEKRLSNFLTFQSTYSELVFTEKMWPEFGREDFLGAIGEFSERQRRFGK